jgi:competence protein ComFC
MSVNDARKLMSSLGFGWLLEAQQKIEKLSLSDLNVIPLLGNFDSGYALGQYSERVDAQTGKTKVGELLHRFKYQFDRDAGTQLAYLATELINRESLLRSSDFIVAVPPSFTSRPFDPISYLTERVSKGTGIKWAKKVMKKTRITGQQKKFFAKELKEENVKSAFGLNDDRFITDKKILLLDDLYASGCTINLISEILRRAGAHKISVLVLAKTSYV